MVTRFAQAAAWSSLALLALAPAVCPAQNLYQQTNLVTDGGDPNIKAKVIDPNLVNAWGLTSFPGRSPFWISDNGTGVSTLYDGNGTPFPPPPNQPLVVAIPAADPVAGANPTGTVANTFGSAFHGESFLFASEDGTISGWRGALGKTAETLVPGSTNSVYKGLALDAIGGTPFLYATNFRANRVDVYDSNLSLQSGFAFTDPNPVSGFAPFNIANIGGNLYVTYAIPDSQLHDDVKGPGHGYIDEYDASGVFVRRFATGTAAGGALTALDSPWSVVQAPGGFGAFSNDLIVGNFGSGMLDAFDSQGNFLGFLNDPSGKPLSIDGLWALEFGSGGPSGDIGKLYFTAGPNDESNGLFGSLQAVPEPGASVPLLLGALSLAGLLARRRKA